MLGYIFFKFQFNLTMLNHASEIILNTLHSLQIIISIVEL